MLGGGRVQRAGGLVPVSEHGAEVLQEAGFSIEEIAALVRDGVTKAAPGTT